jgi:hypothetical protein
VLLDEVAQVGRYSVPDGRLGSKDPVLGCARRQGRFRQSAKQRLVHDREGSRVGGTAGGPLDSNFFR